MPETRPLPELRCPLCGGPNACAPAACGRFDTPCWCTQAAIAPDVLARIPAAQRGRACVCAACARGEPAARDPAPTGPQATARGQ